ncbi:hypothetical protein CBL_01240 [Carabus blaptoides fortunei]
MVEGGGKVGMEKQLLSQSIINRSTFDGISEAYKVRTYFYFSHIDWFSISTAVSLRGPVRRSFQLTTPSVLHLQRRPSGDSSTGGGGGCVVRGSRSNGIGLPLITSEPSDR